MKKYSSTAVIAFTILMTGVCALSSHATNRADNAAASSRPSKPEPCFDANDPSMHRLWQRSAPGALGDDPCRDIPYVQVFPAVDAKASNAPAILIYPGGGYDRLTDTREQAPVARYFAEKLHVTAVLVRYRLVQAQGEYAYPIPMWDGQRAIRVVRAMAPKWGIDANRIGAFGFSAGGHLASTLVLHPNDRFGQTAHDDMDTQSVSVRFLGLGYPVISMDPQDVPPSGSYRNLLKNVHGDEREKLETFLSGEMHVRSNMPPVFLFESTDDKVISPQNALLFASALKQAHVASSVHIFSHGEHGSGLSVGIPEEETWPDDFAAWLNHIGF